MQEHPGHEHPSGTACVCCRGSPSHIPCSENTRKLLCSLSNNNPGIDHYPFLLDRGDILGQSGIQVTYDSLIRRLDSKKGTLNVFSPNWGVTPLGDGNAPLMVRIDRYLTDLVNQIQSDPRIESVKLDMKSLSLSGEVLNIKGLINFIGTSDTREVSI